MIEQTWGWVLFVAIFLSLLYIDLRVGHRQAHEISLKESLLWSAFWITCGLLFGVAIFYFSGTAKGLEFLTGFLLEKSLSLDNLFVFLLVFNYFQVPHKYEYHALFWGIMGAIVIRGVFIFAGVALIDSFSWIIYLFGLFLIYTAFKMVRDKDKGVEPDKNPLLKGLRRWIPIKNEYHSTKFFVKEKGRRFATPMFVIVCVLMVMDVMFAVDSIPAIIAITRDPFIIYTSNIFALMGLRSLYFALAGLMRIFYYLHYGLAALLFYIGIKMLISGFYHIPVGISLAAIITVLLISFLASLRHAKK